MKAQIKSWLKDNALSRDWLAEKLDVSKRTVDNWMSQGGDIPPRAQIAIRALIADTTKIAEGLLSQVFSVECTLEQFRRFSAAALDAGQTLEQWTVAALETEAAEYFRRQSRKPPAGIKPATQPDATHGARDLRPVPPAPDVRGENGGQAV